MNLKPMLNSLIASALLLASAPGLVAQRKPDMARIGAVSDLRSSPTAPRIAPSPSDMNRIDLADLPLQYRDCTSIAYQEWRDDNWEIFIAAGDGSSPQRLTENLIDDEAPALGNGCGQIVFSSDSDDNQDIYAMQPDGTGTIRLTSQPAKDVLPALTLDGTTVALQTYRHGDEPEIYLLNMASHAETRVTNNQEYDGQPDWSPTGEQIAFISDRSGDRNVWVMNRDGSEAEQITYMEHAAAPKWSPDGTRIAFASDDIGTGFTSLWVVNVDGSDPRLVVRADGSQSDAWPDDWSYDSRYILFEEADWEYDNGWYITSASLDIVDPENTDDRQRLVTGGVSMAGAWALCDLAPPTVTLSDLSATSQSPISVSWYGEDTHSSIIYYQAQYRPGSDASWTTWQIEPGQDWTTMTSGQFAWQTLGGTISFRVRAWDILGNVSDWAPDANGALTTLPATLGGQVSDVRGIALANATVACPDSPLPATWTDATGAFALLVAGAWPPSLIASAGPLEPLSLNLPEFTNTQGLSYWLHATDTVLENGGFEQGLAGWYAEGSVVPIQADIAYGQSCMLMGKASLCAAPDALSRTMIQQTITVPADAVYPSLSLAYALGDGTSAPAGQLEVTLIADDASFAILQSSTSTFWQATPSGLLFPLWEHTSVDLSPWKGDSIDIIIAHKKHLGYGMMLVDQVSVSEWLTPYVTSVNPSSVAVGVTAEISIVGYNLSDATTIRLGDRDLATQWQRDHLVATVPSDMPQGRYDLWATNDDGLASVRYDALAIGGYVTIPYVVTP